MALINAIPEKYSDGFEALGKLTEKQFTSIKDALSLLALTSSIKRLLNKIPPIEGLLFENLEEILLSVGSLTPYIESDHMIEQVAKDVASVALADGIINAQEQKILEDRILFLLQNKQIYYAAKASGLNVENGNVFIRSRIITDIRPVFDLSVSDSPKAAIVIHNLHIHYQSDEERGHKDIYLMLDGNDIKALKEDLARAEKKEASLQSVFNKSGLTNLNE